MPLYELIPAGERGTEQTLRRMTELAAKDARNWAFIRVISKIVQGCPSRDHRCELTTLLNFYRGFVRFQPDPLTALKGYVELVQAPFQTLHRRAGDCVSLGQKVVVKNKATSQYEVKAVGDLQETFSGYDALSYSMQDRRWVFSPITQWFYKGKKPLQKVTLRSGQVFYCTPEHKLWLVHQNSWTGEFAPRRETLSDAVKFSPSCIRGLMCAHKIPALNTAPTLTPAQLFIEGLYAAEGYSEAPYKSEISNKNDEIIQRVCGSLDAMNVPYRVRHRKDGVKLVYVKASWLSRRLHSLFGRDSFTKHFPDEYLSLSAEAMQILLEGYAVGDAYFPKPGSRWHNLVSRTYNTSSDELAQQVMLMHMILGTPLSSYYQRNHMGAGHRAIWRLMCRDKNSGRSHIERLPGIENGCIKRVEDAGNAEVCDISVAGTRNFVTEHGVVLSNCDDFSVLIAASALALGLRPKFVVVKANPKQPEEWSHVYASVQVNGKWLAVDPTVKESTLGWEPRRFFKRGDWLI